MKCLVKLLLVTVVMIPCFANEAAAQRPFERLQRGLDDLRPRGRILRELFGENDAEEKQRKAEEARRKAQQQTRRNQGNRKAGSPTPATPRNTRGQNNSNRGQINSSAPESSTPNRQAGNRQNAAKAKHPTELQFALKETKGSKGLVVEKIGPKGAAYLAGIRRGDVLLSIGGLEVANKEDVSSITSIMKDGDQIEFEVSRRGKKEKLLVQFGDPPVDENEQDDLAPSVQASPARAGAPSENPSLRSVLNGGNSSANATRPQNDYRRPTNNASNPSPIEWPVTPPTATSRRNAPAAVRSATERPTMIPEGNEQVRELSRQLEQQRREIQRLRQQLQQQQSGGSSTKEKDPLLDFDS